MIPSDSTGGAGIDLTIVIPAFNEENRLPATLERILAYLSERGRRAELIVCDDGSSDRTADRARSILEGSNGVESRILREDENRGKGDATRRGMLAARGDRVLFSDADLSTPIEEVEKLDRALDAGFDVAIGSRSLARSDVTTRQPVHRQTMGRVFNLLMRTLVLPGVCDSQCGFKLFTRDAARELFSRATVDGWAFDVEVLLLARRMGYRVREVPIRWVNSEDSRISLMGGSLSMLLDLVRIRTRPGETRAASGRDRR